MPYVDGFLLPVAKKDLAAYRRVARKASKIFMDLGAIEYRECVGDDLNIKGMTPFPDAAKCKKGETVVFSWIVYKSRAQRDRVNAKIMQDPRMAAMMEQCSALFNPKRMSYGGFKVIVEA